MLIFPWEMIKMTLGELISKYRKENGLSLKEFGTLVGASKGYIHILEKGINPSTKKPPIPRTQILISIAETIGTDLTSLLELLNSDNASNIVESTRQKRTIPVLGSVIAGIPIEAIEDIIDYEEIGEDILKTGTEFFGLKVKGNSMSPMLLEGDTLIIKKQDDCENGNIAVVFINGDEATVKKVVKHENGIILQPINPAYDPISFTKKEINKLPVKILGIVVELRRKQLQ